MGHERTGTRESPIARHSTISGKSRAARQGAASHARPPEWQWGHILLCMGRDSLAAWRLQMSAAWRLVWNPANLAKHETAYFPVRIDRAFLKHSSISELCMEVCRSWETMHHEFDMVVTFESNSYSSGVLEKKKEKNVCPSSGYTHKNQFKYTRLFRQCQSGGRCSSSTISSPSSNRDARCAGNAAGWPLYRAPQGISSIANARRCLFVMLAPAA